MVVSLKKARNSENENIAIYETVAEAVVLYECVVWVRFLCLNVYIFICSPLIFYTFV